MSAVISEMYKVILAPLTTEKTNKMSDKYNRLVFKVATWANKVQIKNAIEGLFKVKVEQVATINMYGKTKMFKQRIGKKSDWKKAIVRIQKGQDIKILEFINQ
ncbi:MAG: 50S ribosomal protein L23 [Gammaproteobacteria bacterium]